MSKAEEYSQKLKAELKDIEAEMKHLEADIERAKADGKNDLDEFRREVSAQYEKSRFVMEKLRASGEASLEQVKQSAEMAYLDLRKAISNARNRLSG